LFDFSFSNENYALKSWIQHSYGDSLQHEDAGECEEIPQQHENNVHKIEHVFCSSLSAAPSVM
jgi:hypothetical protein